MTYTILMKYGYKYKRYNIETEDYLSDFGISRFLNQDFSVLKENIEWKSSP